MWVSKIPHIAYIMSTLVFKRHNCRFLHVPAAIMHGRLMQPVNDSGKNTVMEVG